MFAPRKESSLRFCVHYRKLDVVVARSSYPLTGMYQCIDSLEDAKVFYTLDASSKYWQIEIDERNRDKTTFISHHGVYRFQRIPFGLNNALETFQKAMDVIPASARRQLALIYLEDIFVFSKSPVDYKGQVRHVLRLLHEAKLRLG